MTEEVLRTRALKLVQVSTQSLILIVALIAVWFTVWINTSQIQLLEARVATASNLARELVVDDPQKIAVVAPLATWSNDDRWRIYLPPGSYRINLATREIDTKGLAPAVATATISHGYHDLAFEKRLEGDTWKAILTVDNKIVLQAEEPRGWNLERGYTGTDGHSVSRQFPADAPLILMRTRFSMPNVQGATTTPPGPCEGVQIWLEPLHDAPTGKVPSPATP